MAQLRSMSDTGTSSGSTSRRARAKVWRRAGALAWLPWSYAKDLEFKGVDRPLVLAVRLWTESWTTRIGLIFLLISVLGAAWLLSHDVTAKGAAITPADFAAAVLLAGAWSGAVTLAAGWPLWAFGIAGVYLVYFSILPGGPLWLGTPMPAVPRLWILFVALWIFRSTRPRHVGHVLVWALVAWAGAWVTVGPLRVRAAFGAAHEQLAVAALGVAYFVAGCVCAARNRGGVGRLNAAPGFGPVAGISLLLLALYWGSSLLFRPRESVENVRMGTTLVLAQVDLLWMGLGGGFLLGAVGVGRWTTRATYDVLSPRVARWIWPVLWACAALFSWVMFWSTSMSSTWVVMQLGLVDWRKNLPTSLYFVGRYHGLFSAAALVALLILAARKKATPRAIATINALWTGAYLGLTAWYAAMDRAAHSADARSGFDAFWPAMVLLGGVLWSMGKSEKNWRDVAGRKLEIQLVMMALVLGLAVSPAGLGTVDMFGVQALATLVGMTHLGLPRAIHAEIMRGRRVEPDQAPGSGELLALFALGALSSIPCLMITLQPRWPLLLALPIWMVLLVLVRHRRPRWISPAGPTAGAAVALGFAWAWWFPPTYEIPFFTPWLTLRQSWIDAPTYRWPFSWEHLTFVISCAGIGTTTGWAVFRRNRAAESGAAGRQ